MSAVPQDFHEGKPVIVALRVNPIGSGTCTNGPGHFIATFQIRNLPGLIPVGRENTAMVKSACGSRLRDIVGIGE